MKRPIRLHNPGNELPRITEMWAFLSVDAEGKEGICRMPLDGMTIPMVFAKPSLVTKVLPIARQLARAAEMQIRVVRFSTRTEVRLLGVNGEDEDDQ